MKYLNTITIAIVLFSCQTEPLKIEQDKKDSLIKTVEAETIIKEKPVDESTRCGAESIIENSDKYYDCEDYEDSIVFYYDNYVVNTQQHQEYNGYVVSVTDKVTNSYLEIGTEESCFFMGMFKQYIIIDEGTGQMRTVKIYDSNRQEMIFSSSYVGELIIKENELFFNDQIEITDTALIPECSKELQGMEYGIGYIENLIYSFTQQELSRTGNYECCYFE